MQKYLETGKEVVLNKKRIIFASDSQGYSFPSHIYVKFNPNFDHGINYIALLKPIIALKDKGVILLFANGRIDSFSKNLSNLCEVS